MGLREWYRRLYKPAVTCPRERAAADKKLELMQSTAETLVEQLETHRRNNHLSQRIAAAYRTEPRWSR